MKPLYTLITTATVCLLAAGSTLAQNDNAQSASTQTDNGGAFEALFRNEIETALEHWEGDDSELALQGQLLAAWSRGNSPDMARTLKRLIENYPNSAYTVAYLSFLGMPELQGWDLKERATVLEAAYNAAQTPALKQRIAEEWAQTLEMLLDPAVEDAARKAGTLMEHWAVVGPFGKHGTPDLETRLGPEKEIKASYTGWQREAKFKNVSPIDKAGMIELDTHAGPSNAVGYLFNTIEARDTGQMWLTVESPSSVRVWWNGEPVIEKAAQKLHTGKAYSVQVPVKQGSNVIAIKVQKTGEWWARAYLQDVDGGSIDWRTRPFDASAHEDLYLKPFSAPKFNDVECEGLASPYPFEMDGGDDARMVIMAFLDSVYHANLGQTEAAREQVALAMQRVPAFSLGHAFYGDMSLRLAVQRPGSRSRFQQEAETALQEALKLDPLSRNALLGLQTYFVDRAQIDPALDIMKSHVEAHPEVLSQGYRGMVDYAFGLLYKHKGFQTEAMEKFKSVMESDYVPSYEVYNHLSDYYEDRQQIDKAVAVLNRAVDVFPGFTRYLLKSSVMTMRTEQGPDALALLNRVLEIHPHSPDYAMAKAVTLIRLGRQDEAMTLMKRYEERYPHLPRFKQFQARLAFQEGDRKQGLDAYRELYAAHPNSDQAFHAMRDVAQRPDFAYMKYDASWEDIDPAEAEKWEDSRASSIYLLDIMVQEYHQDGTYSQYVHQAVKILNQDGMDNWAETVIPQGVEVIMAKTITPQGIEWPVSNVQDLNNQQSLSMYGVEPGAIVEYAYLMRGGRDDPGINGHQGGYYFGAENDPMLLSKLTILVPDDLPFYIDADPVDFTPERSRDGDRIVYQWENRNQDGLKEEPFAPPLTERVPTVHWSTFSGFDTLLSRHEFSKWGYEEKSQLIDNQVKAFEADSENTMDYIETVFTWIRDEIDESSSGNTTADTIALKAGGQFQKLRLLRQMLAKAGVRSHMAVAFDTEQANGYGPMPDINLQGVSVLIVPKQEGVPERLVLELSSRYVPFGDLAPGLNRLMALVYDANPAYVEPVNSAVWPVGVIEKAVDLKLNDDLSATLEGHYAYTNAFDRQIRQAVNNPDVRQRLADQQLSNDFRGVQIAAHSLADIENLSETPKLVFNGRMPDLLSETEGALRFRPVLDLVEASNFIAGANREAPMVFDTPPIHAPLEISFDLSEFVKAGKRIVVPENKLLMSEFGVYALTFDWQEDTLRVKRSFILYEQRITPEKYPLFVEFCRTVDQAEQEPVRMF